MLTVGKVGPGNAGYYQSGVVAGVEDYYASDGDAPGRWIGQCDLVGAVARSLATAVDIPPEMQSRIFEPRFTTKDGRVQFGLGLGLSISRQIVEEHNGTVGVESRPGRTVFTVVLPTEGAA